MHKTVDDLTDAFALYFEAIRECARPGCYWGLLHVVVALPDVCAALEYPQKGVTDRYIDWCSENFRAPGKLSAIDRYQVRNALLHEGSTLPVDRSRSGSRPSQFAGISFVEPGQNGADLHGNVNRHADGDNLLINIATLADETRQAVLHWFNVLQASPARNATVATHLSKVSRNQMKLSHIAVDAPTLPRGLGASIVISHPTKSSTST